MPNLSDFYRALIHTPNIIRSVDNFTKFPWGFSSCRHNEMVLKALRVFQQFESVAISLSLLIKREYEMTSPYFYMDLTSCSLLSLLVEEKSGSFKSTEGTTVPIVALLKRK